MRLKLATLRTGFALGGRLAPRRTVERAARLFATPFASSRARARAAETDPAMRQERIVVDGCSIATYVWGDPATQPYVLLVHGWSSFGLRFRPWVQRLRALGLAVVSFDQPGHGLSDGRYCTLPEFAATVRAVGRHYGDAELAIGHSLGGAALVLAQDHATRYFRFVRLGEHLRRPFYDWLVARTGVPVEQLQMHRHAAALGQPGLVVHDLDDADVPWDEGERYARHWPGARLFTTQGLGHHRVLEAPEVIDAVLAFATGAAVGERVVASPNLPFGLA
jgi:pimeloyl-ACP methyl ester carboxylesterase